MWKTLYAPEMTLPPKHARLFRLAAWYLSDEIEADEQEDMWSEDDSVFGRLTRGQKHSVLLEVTRALLDERIEAPSVNAVRAATVDQVYRALEEMITSDVEMDGGTEIREMLLEAMDEANYWENVNDGRMPGEERFERPAASSSNLSDWELFIEELRTSVLDDSDFALDAHISDMDPLAAAEVKRYLSIEPDYFTYVPDDPTAEQLKQIRQDLVALANG